MISGFFSKTKPIAYLVLFLLFLIFYTFRFFVWFAPNEYGHELLPAIIALLFIVLQLAVLNQLVITTGITQKSTLPLLVFTILLIGFLDVAIVLDTIIANLFLIWALYGLLQLDKTKNERKKIVDVSLLLCIATVFKPIALLFFPVIFMGIALFSSNKLKNWLVPLVVMASAFLIGSAAIILFGLRMVGQEDYLLTWDNNFLKMGDFVSHYSRMVVFVLTLLLLFLLLQLRGGRTGGLKILKFRFLFFVYMVAILISVFSFGSGMGQQMLLFSFCPAALLTTGYLEIFRLKRIKEILLVLGMAIPLTFTLYRLLTL